MAKKSGSLKAKRSATPAFWQISRKDKRFVVRTFPGPHPKSYSYPLLVVLRDVLGIAKTRREALSVLNQGKVNVDGRVVKAEAFPIGMMDVIDFPETGKSFRMVPHYGRLVPVEIGASEKGLKLVLCQVEENGSGLEDSAMGCTTDV